MDVRRFTGKCGGTRKHEYRGTCSAPGRSQMQGLRASRGAKRHYVPTLRTHNTHLHTHRHYAPTLRTASGYKQITIAAYSFSGARERPPEGPHFMPTEVACHGSCRHRSNDTILSV